MGNLLLLFVVRLHLVDLIFALCLHKCRVITSVVDELFDAIGDHYYKTNIAQGK